MTTRILHERTCDQCGEVWSDEDPRFPEGWVALCHKGKELDFCSTEHAMEWLGNQPKLREEMR